MTLTYGVAQGCLKSWPNCAREHWLFATCFVMHNKSVSGDFRVETTLCSRDFWLLNTKVKVNLKLGICLPHQFLEALSKRPAGVPSFWASRVWWMVNNFSFEQRGAWTKTLDLNKVDLWIYLSESYWTFQGQIKTIQAARLTFLLRLPSRIEINSCIPGWDC